jgi:hypothetical protein
MYWGALQATLHGISKDGSKSLKSTLEMDDVDGDGPETIRFNGIGECDVRSKCLITFELDNYTPLPCASWDWGCGDMGASDISVTLFHGTEKTTFPVGATPGSSKRWKVFTIDARTAKMYPNVDNEELHQAPYVEKKENYHGEVTQDWNNCLDHAMWCTLAHGQLITGLKRSGPVNLNNFQEAAIGLVKESPEVDCTAHEVGFGGPDEKWGVCKTGQFMWGLLRSGAGSEVSTRSGAQQLEQIMCCDIADVGEAYGECTDVDMPDKGWAKCGDNAAIVGLHKTAGPKANIDKVRCCELPEKDLLPGPSLMKSGHKVVYSPATPPGDPVAPSEESYNYYYY